MFNIVLYNPQIPQNTGNIARSCALTGSVLHLIKPLGFSIDDKHLKRAGLDYWDKMTILVYDSFEHFVESCEPNNLHLYTTKAEQYYTQASYRPDDYLMFGSETSGVPQNIHEYCATSRYTIPMRAGDQLRSLNLSNSVSIVLYEALRQNNFYGLK
jgi:tRNA (cytidine/uridine-2'-O-)-methyltransferase